VVIFLERVFTTPVWHKKLVEPDIALSSIEDNSVVAISGFNMATTPEYLIERLYKLYLKTGHPKNLFIITDTFPGSPGRGLDLIAKDLYKKGDKEFIRGILTPYLGWSEWLQRMVLEEMIEAYTWSIGVMAYWFREVGSGRPGVLTKVGIGTFLDPRYEGGALNEKAKKARTVRVDVIKVEGEEYLLYRAPKPNVALIRGTTADEIGNLTMEDEGIFGTVLNIAQAAKAMPNKGIVIAQVQRIARFGSLNPKEVVVPGPLIDYIVVAPRDKHWQSASIDYDPRISGRIMPPLDPSLYPPLELGPRKVIARRVLLELVKLIEELGRPIIVNLGVGIPSHVGQIAVEEEISDYIAVTVESGPWGGVPLSGVDFGVSIGPYAIIPMPDQFTLYEGGIIDAASLGFLQVDEKGNVNSSMLPNRIPGPGGFPVIAAGSPRLYFAGEFTAGPRKITVENGRLVIRENGPIKKFVRRVYKIFCNATNALKSGKEVLYITERAIFKLTHDGLELIEVAPGVDVDKDIIQHMEFEPKISPKLSEMDKSIFSEGKMNLKLRVIKALKA
jgi:propionate CoA-transferase